MGQDKLGTLALLFLLGVAISLWQLATITNFRGMRDDNTARTLRGLRRVEGSSYRSLENEASTRKFADGTQIVVSVVFLLLGVVFIVIAIVGTILAFVGD